MNFKDFYEITNPVPFSSAPGNLAPIQALNQQQAADVILKITKNSFGKIPQTDVTTFQSYGPGIKATTQSREIEINVTHMASKRLFGSFYSGTTLPVADISFSWNYSNRQGQQQKSPKDNQHGLYVRQEPDKETISLMHAFKDFLIQLRNHPIGVSYVAVDSHSVDGNIANRRSDLYKKMFIALGYIKVMGGFSLPLWIPPLLKKPAAVSNSQRSNHQSPALASALV